MKMLPCRRAFVASCRTLNGEYPMDFQGVVLMLQILAGGALNA